MTAPAPTELLLRLETSQKNCFDKGLHIAAMDIQAARAEIARLTALPRSEVHSREASPDSAFPLKYIDGPDYCTVETANGANFAMTLKPDLMKAMERAICEDIARLSRPPAQAVQVPKSVVPDGMKPVYLKPWRTIFMIPAGIADAVRDTINAPSPLAWLADHTNFEITYSGWDEDPVWQVHSVNGGRNDREWTLRATGSTPEEALRRAMAIPSADRGPLEVDLNPHGIKRGV